MVSNIDLEEGKSAILFAGNAERKFSESSSKISFEKLYNEELSTTTTTTTITTNSETEPPASSTCKKSLKPGSAELLDLDDFAKSIVDTFEEKESPNQFHETKSEPTPEHEKAKKEDDKKMEEVKATPEQVPSPEPKVAETHKADSEVQNKPTVGKKPSDTALNATEGKIASGVSKFGKPRPEMNQRRPSEIPKLKSLLKAGRGTLQKPNMFQSRLPVKTTEKESESKQTEKAPDGLKNKPESMKTMMKSYNGKKDLKTNEKVKQALAENFNYLVPLYEREFKKISDVWVNTIYCSLTMRTNLVKLLFQAFPNINRTQFHTEDERLLHCIAHAKSCTKLEAENLIKLIKNLVASRDKTKEEYGVMITNKQIAECYNNDWRKLLRKMSGLGEEAKHLQMETPQLQRKKEVNEVNTNEKIRRMEINLCKKEDEIKKLANQLHILKQKENSSYKDSISLKIPEYKEIRAEAQSLAAVQKEYEELKAKYLFQNYTYEKKIKDLEHLVEEKKKILEKEREMKKQLQAVLNQLQAHQKRLTMSIGKEQVEYVMGRTLQDRRKRREQLWLAAVKLVLRGFLIQLKRLERDRNKMLLEIHSNDFENFTEPTFIIQKDNFIKSIKQQMNDLQKMCNQPNIKSSHC